MKYLFITSIAANIILLFLFLRLLKMNKLLRSSQPLNEGPLSTGTDLFNDLTKSNELYRKLKREMHPDKFIGNEELRQYAENQMMELGKVEHSYTSMMILVEEMKKKGFPFSEEFQKNHN